MTTREYLMVMIDRLEYCLTKDIEKNLYGCGQKCYLSLYDQLEECIEARRSINYKPYTSVKDLLVDFGYDDDFIEKFLTRANCNNRNQ